MAAPDQTETSAGVRRTVPSPGLTGRELLQIARLNVRDSALAHARALVKSRQCRPVSVRAGLAAARVVVVLVVKDEFPRLAFILDFYRRLGADHFVVIDNGSSDGGREFLEDREDVSLFVAQGSYGDARYGTDWVNGVLRQHCVGKWVLWVDADELLVFSERQGVTLHDLAAALRREGRRSLQTLMLDMYSSRRPADNVVRPGTDPLDVCDLFDKVGYRLQWHRVSHTGWIKGGVRGRLFFEDISDSPALNKTPFVRWRRHYVFLKSAHQLWPRRANGTGRLGGALLHFKFTDATARKMTDPGNRSEHTAEYTRYDDVDEVDYRGPSTVAYQGVGQLRQLGLVEPWL